MELEQIHGGYSADGVITEFGAQLAADGLNYMESGNVIKSSLGTFVAAGGGWIWAFGSAYDGVSSLFN
jgi:hypothetical protein